jgi:hypothetical protein
MGLSSLILLGGLLAQPTPAQAQATRTWVSGVGDDANPCSRTAPCKTFAGAISKTAAGGEISVLDPGGFGAVTITKAITLNGDGTLAAILASGTNGVVVNAGANDTVVLRNLSINGAGTGLNGIRYLAGKALIVDRTALSGFTQNNIDVALAAAGNLVVKDTSITGGATGVMLNTSAGRLNASLDRVSIQGASVAIDALKGFVSITDSVLTQSTGFGVLADGTSAISLEQCMLSQNATAVQAQTGATVRVSDSDIFDNLTGFGCGGGTIASASNNRKAGNVGGGAACAPNATITIQ